MHGSPERRPGAAPAARRHSTEPLAQERLACAHVQPHPKHQPAEHPPQAPGTGTGFPKACAENAPGTGVPLAART